MSYNVFIKKKENGEESLWQKFCEKSDIGTVAKEFEEKSDCDNWVEDVLNAGLFKKTDIMICEILGWNIAADIYEASAPEDEETEYPISYPNLGIAPSIDKTPGAPDTNLMADATYAFEDGKITVSLPSGQKLAKHRNDNGIEGYWAGIWFEAPEGATGFNYAETSSKEFPDTWQESSVLEENIDGNGKQGATIYYNLETKKSGFFALQWVDIENEPVVVEIDFIDVSLEE